MIVAMFEGPTASHTSSDIDMVPPPRRCWHLIHRPGRYFRISNSQQGITGKCQCCVGLGPSRMQIMGAVWQVANFLSAQWLCGESHTESPKAEPNNLNNTFPIQLWVYQCLLHLVSLTLSQKIICKIWWIAESFFLNNLKILTVRQKEERTLCMWHVHCVSSRIIFDWE